MRVFPVFPLSRTLMVPAQIGPDKWRMLCLALPFSHSAFTHARLTELIFEFVCGRRWAYLR